MSTASAYFLSFSNVLQMSRPPSFTTSLVPRKGLAESLERLARSTDLRKHGTVSSSLSPPWVKKFKTSVPSTPQATPSWPRWFRVLRSTCTLWLISDESYNDWHCRQRGVWEADKVAIRCLFVPNAQIVYIKPQSTQWASHRPTADRHSVTPEPSNCCHVSHILILLRLPTPPNTGLWAPEIWRDRHCCCPPTMGRPRPSRKVWCSDFFSWPQPMTNKRETNIILTSIWKCILRCNALLCPCRTCASPLSSATIHSQCGDWRCCCHACGMTQCHL